MFKPRLQPSFLIPFGIITPYLFIGRYGVTLFEILIGFSFIVQFCLLGSSLRIHKIIQIHIVLLIIGYGIALLNGKLHYSVPIGIGDLKIFYWVMLSVSGLHFGYKYFQDLDTIAQSKSFKVALIFLGLFVGAYPFLDYDTKMLLMRPFYHPDLSLDDLKRIYYTRFPGLGVNANTYGFMTLILFYIALQAAFKKKLSWLFPLLAFTAIVGMGSKTVLGLSIMLIYYFLFFSPVTQKKKIKIFIVSVILFFFGGLYLFFSDTGIQLREYIVIIDRIITATSDPLAQESSGIGTRINEWRNGMERVSISPLAGIPIVPGTDDSDPLYFTAPHNEFIAFWMFTGFVGLAAYVLLLGWLLVRNLSVPNGYFWVGLYGALIIQMFFDAAFQSVRFIPLMFLMIGINLRQINLAQKSKRRVMAHSPLLSTGQRC